LIPTKTLLVRLRALWFAASIISSIWFLCWIFYDVLVWNKALTQARPLNYVGLILSIALILLGTQLEKIGIGEKPTPLVEQIQHKKQMQPKKRIQQTQQVQQVPEAQPTSPTEQTRQIQPGKEEEKQMPQDSSIPPGCQFYLGYLRERPKSAEIPQECLLCLSVIHCLSPTAPAKVELNQ